MTPLQGSKLAAFKIDDGALEVYFQAADESIQGLEYSMGNSGWRSEEKIIIGSGKAKAGTPLSALVGGWREYRLFYVTRENKLAGVYGDAHTNWRDSRLYHVLKDKHFSPPLTEMPSHPPQLRFYPTNSLPRP